MKVLIADDDASTRLMLRRLVVSWGFEVVEAADGERAWQELNSDDPPRIALVDWMMPLLDGVAVCNRLSSAQGRPLIYRILLTVKSDTSALVEALDSGAHDFVSKPVSAPALRSRVLVGKRLVEAEDRVQKQAQEMARLALLDALTGIDNRRAGEARLHERLSELSRGGAPVGLVLIDIDRFKRINDRFGHAVGDQFIKLVAHAVRSRLRAHDYVARWGGEEFVALVAGVRDDTLAAVAEHLRRTVEEASVPGPQGPVRATISIGATLLRPDDSDGSALARADSLLYESKRAGRNRVTTG